MSKGSLCSQFSKRNRYSNVYTDATTELGCQRTENNVSPWIKSWNYMWPNKMQIISKNFAFKGYKIKRSNESIVVLVALGYRWKNKQM